MNEEGSADLPHPKVEPLHHEPDWGNLDLDAYSPPPPPKNRGKIQVRIRYKGRGKPLLHPKLEGEKP
jgi:hypothetical protein